jgi:multidrug resistance efflux pump
VEGPDLTPKNGTGNGGRRGSDRARTGTGAGSAASGNGHREPERDGATLTASRPEPPAPAPAPPAKRRLKRSTKIGLLVVGVITLLEAIAFGGNYYFNTRHYVTTDNAKVDGDEMRINAPATGNLTRWLISEGSVVRPNQIVGRIRLTGGGPQAEQVIKSPGGGRIAINSAVDGQYVTAGTQLATSFGSDKLYVTARVDEGDAPDVKVGQPVDIAVDAYPDAKVTGTVVEVQGSSAGVFSLYPPAGTDPSNPQKVDQYIPVKILFTNTDGAAVRPGENVTVHIRKP